MRYTTIIDVTEMPAVLRCRSAVWLYYLMAMKCGYHDDDRDVLDMSLTQLANASGLTVSAVRHAIRVLVSAHLVKRDGLHTWTVRKWIQETTITPRRQTKRQERLVQKHLDEAAEQAQREAALEAERRKNEALWAKGKSPFIVYCESLKTRAGSGDEEAAAAFKRNEAAYLRALEKAKQLK